MPGLAKVMDHCALVRSLGHTITRARAGHDLHGHGQPARAPRSITRAWARWRLGCLPPREGVPPYVTFAALRDGVAGSRARLPWPGVRPVRGRRRARHGEHSRSHGVSLPSGFSPGDLESREALRRRFDRGLRRSTRPMSWRASTASIARPLEILYSDRVRSALDLSREPAGRARDDYGRTPLGQGALAARRLIEAGARFVTLGFGGWDTHGDNFRALRDRLLPPAGQGDLAP